jgi:hypothetical protein
MARQQDAAGADAAAHAEHTLHRVAKVSWGERVWSALHIRGGGNGMDLKTVSRELLDEHHKRELQETIKRERKEAKRTCAAKLRYLTSCSAERLSDYHRINLFVTAGAEAAALLEAE